MRFRHRNRSHDLSVGSPEHKSLVKSDGKPASDSLDRARKVDGPHPVTPLDRFPRGRSDTIPKRTPTSRKTGFATIRTDSTDTHAAFESDAFAVLMPTTRLPILDEAIPPANTFTPAARAQAFRTYQEKAREVRERNTSQGVQVPSKLITYGSTPARVAQWTSTQRQASPPNSPGQLAGSFPISPPLPQTGWNRPEETQVLGSRVRAERSNICTPRKPVVSVKTNTSPRLYHVICRADSEAGASRSQTPSPTTIKIRLKPKDPTCETTTAHPQRTPNFPNGLAPVPSIRSSSPTKSMPNFTRQNSVEGDSIFGYKSKDATGTRAGAREAAINEISNNDQGSLKKAIQQRTLASKWSWLRSTSVRTTKPDVTPAIAVPTITKAPTSTAAYVDPFVSLSTPTATPNCLRSPASKNPSSPKKLTRATATDTSAIDVSPTPEAMRKFDSGFAQIKGLILLLIKCGLTLYAILALWYILEAAREVFNTICAPFRVIRWVGGWMGILTLWALRIGIATWERWGFQVALGGGWMWKLRW